MPNVSGSPDPFDQFVGLMAMHEEVLKKLKAFIVPKTPIDKGTFLDEYQSGIASPLTFTLQVDRPVIIRSILYAFTPIAAATLSIGPASGTTRTIPIAATSTANPNTLPVDMISKPGDVFTLTCVGATALFLEVMGDVLSGTDWSQV